MAIRSFPQEIEENAHLVANVWTIDGKYYECCDLPPQPFGKKEEIFSFWHNDAVMVIPLHQIKAIQMMEDRRD